MPAYDPQRTRNRPALNADKPAPVDAFLDAVTEISEVTTLPQGVDIEVTPGGDTIVHTLDADVAVTAAGDDVVVSTRDARVEVRAENDEVIVDTAGEEIFIDTSPRSTLDPSSWSDTPIVQSTDNGRSKLVIAIVAGLAALAAVLLVSRKRR